MLKDKRYLSGEFWRVLMNIKNGFLGDFSIPKLSRDSPNLRKKK